MRIVQLGLLQLSLVKLRNSYKGFDPKNTNNEYKKSSIIS